jgi:hypothetical protein
VRELVCCYLSRNLGNLQFDVRPTHSAYTKTSLMYHSPDASTIAADGLHELDCPAIMNNSGQRDGKPALVAIPICISARCADRASAELQPYDRYATDQRQYGEDGTMHQELHIRARYKDRTSPDCWVGHTTVSWVLVRARFRTIPSTNLSILIIKSDRSVKSQCCKASVPVEERRSFTLGSGKTLLRRYNQVCWIMMNGRSKMLGDAAQDC